MSTSSQPWRLGSKAWFGLLILALVAWLVISQAALIVEVGAVLFGAYLLSLAISPVADFMAARRVPRAVTVLVFYGLMFAVLVLAGRLLVPVIRMETRHLRQTLPTVLDRGLSTLRGAPVLHDLVPSTTALREGILGGIDTYARPAFAALISAGSLAVDFFVLLVLSFFFVTDRQIGDRLLYNWIPAAYQPRVRRLTAALRSRLVRWVWAQAAVALYFAVAFSTVLALLRVPFAFTIGVIGGLLEIFPYVGGFIAFTLAILSALSVNPILVLWIAVLYVIVVETESHVLAPALYGRLTGLHPAVVLVALLVGVKMLHLLGVLFAVPLAVVVVTIVDEAQGRLSDPAAVVTGPIPEPMLPISVEGEKS